MTFDIGYGFKCESSSKPKFYLLLGLGRQSIKKFEKERRAKSTRQKRKKERKRRL